MRTGETVWVPYAAKLDGSFPAEDVPAALAPIASTMREIRSFNDDSCVYFLIKGEDVVYVGKTSSIHHRAIQHARTKDFDRILFIYVARDALGEWEGFFIRLLSPPLNVHGKNGYEGWDEEQREALGLRPRLEVAK